MRRRTVLGLMAGAVPMALPSDVDGVTLVDLGDTVTVSNGLVSATLHKATGQTIDLRLTGSRSGNQDVNLVSGLNGGGYSTFSASTDSGESG